MRRREFIFAIGGLVAAWSTTSIAQQSDAARQIAVLMPYPDNDSSATARLAALKAGLQELGWVEGRNLHMEIRYAPKLDAMTASAAELVNLKPDILVTTTNLATLTLYRDTQTIPIVFIGGGDMIKEGLVASLARPGRNVTGFTNFEPAMGSKWLELLAEMAPQIRRAGFIYNPDTLANVNDMRAAQSAVPSHKIEVVPLSVHNLSEIERSITNFAAGADSGLIVAPNPVTIGNHNSVVGLIAGSRLPAIYPFDFYATAGGLMSYGPDQIDMFRRAATYLDRILKGEPPAVLPLQMPVKYQLIINAKAAKSLGISVPITLLARADRVIE